MTPPRRRARRAVGALSIVASAAGLVGCSGPTGGAGDATPDAPPAVAPLDTTTATPAAAVAVVAMGTLGDPLDTFWQLFVQSGATTAWKLVTPPGVADNGGLAVSVGPGTAPAAGPELLVGFEPSQDLVFSPLAQSDDRGGSWSPGLLPAGLAKVPDALASSAGGTSFALVRAGGGQVLRNTLGTPRWSELVGRATLASSPGGRSCALGALTAVASDAGGDALVGTTCTAAGVVGIFAAAGGAWHLVGPRLASRPGPTTVLRLVGVEGQPNGLVATARHRAVSLVGVARSAGGAWSRSAPLALGPGSHVLSTGVEAGGGFVVLTARSGGPSALDAETGPAGGWRSLPSPPAGTATVAVGPGGEVDALAVASTRLTDWRLDAPSGMWDKIATVTVPIEFGSSS